MITSYPRVVFVTPSAFNKITGGGITFSNLFYGWPKESLLTVTNDVVPVTHDVCDRYYFLSKDELNYIIPVSWIYSKKAPTRKNQPHFPSKNRSGLPAPMFNVAKKLVGEGGIPDRGRLTEKLRKWIKEFGPDVLYSILGSPGYIDLVGQIQEDFDLPLVIHLMDEGVTNPNKKGLFGKYWGRIYRDKFQKILQTTNIGIAICESMAKEYTKRYGISFVHFQNVVELDRWNKFAKQEISIIDEPKLVYAGSVLHYAQLQSLIDCCEAVKKLNNEGLNLRFDIYTPKHLFYADKDRLEIHPKINIHDIPQDDEAYFKILGGADILLLPVNFDHRSINFIRLSMPTKIPSYLLSGTPILVFGPTGVAQVEYAREYGWGYVVTKRDQRILSNAIQELTTNYGLREELSTKAKLTVKTNHDAAEVRKAFKETLARAARL